MAAITYRAVSDVDFSAFTSAFNLAYSDYFVPIMMSVPSFRALIDRDDLDLEASVAALDTDTIVGTGLLGIRDQGGWIGGMGVIPRRRREGIGRQMMLYLLDRARERELSWIDLEVIEQNRGAYALYHELGFADRRTLLVLERDAQPFQDQPSPYSIGEDSPARLLAYYTAFHEIPNAWQRGFPSLQALAPHLQGWAVKHDGDIMGYALGWANESDIRLMDIVINPAFPAKEGALALLHHLHHQFPAAQGSIYNIADNDPVLPAYQALGYAASLRQIEMQLILR